MDNIYYISNCGFSCENKWKPLICLYSIQDFLIKKILSWQMATTFWEYPPHGEASKPRAFDHCPDKALFSKDVHSTSMILHIFHVALAYLGFQDGIESLMLTCCILILWIISRQPFSLNPVNLFVTEYRHFPYFLLILEDIRTLIYHLRFSQISSSLSHLLSRSQPCKSFN